MYLYTKICWSYELISSFYHFCAVLTHKHILIAALHRIKGPHWHTHVSYFDSCVPSPKMSGMEYAVENNFNFCLDLLKRV